MSISTIDLTATDYVAELRHRLALTEAQKPLVARAKAMQQELRGRATELGRNPASWAQEELAAIAARLDELDELTEHGWFSDDEDRALRLAAWLVS